MKIGLNELYSELSHQQSFLYALLETGNINEKQFKQFKDQLDDLKLLNWNMAEKFGNYIETVHEDDGKVTVKEITSKDFYNF